MRLFARLYRELDESNRTSDKVAALVRYFREAPDADAAWALYFFTGRRIRRAVNHRQLREAAAEVSGQPLWLVDECYHAVGDLSETLALLLPPPAAAADLPLHTLVETRLLPLPAMGDAERRASLRETWAMLDEWQRFIFHKLIGGEFRTGVSAILTTRALAEAAGVEPAVMMHRLTGRWKPTPGDYRALVAGEAADDPAKPYPFALAHTVEDAPGFPDLQAALGPPGDWQAEWKWDGIRAQLIRRGGRAVLWSRGEELIGEAFPEIVEAAGTLPDGTVLDGEVLAWMPGSANPLPFASLQRRLGRKKVELTLFGAEVPVVFVAYDLLESDGLDLRRRPMAERRRQLEALIDRFGGTELRLSPLLAGESWEALAGTQAKARAVAAEGLMLKRRDSAYGTGRHKGDWWKWKVDPYVIDAVMLHAQPGHGERASLLSDYTFGVWSEGTLVPIVKAYSGLTDDELRRVDAWARKHTIQTHGPVRIVEPVQVFELAFEGIQRSTRHRAGLALRFPRMKRWRTDKRPEEADRLATVEAMLRAAEAIGEAR